METVFLICAIAGGTLILAQVVLSLLGLGHLHDATGDHFDAGGGDHDLHEGSADHDHHTEHGGSNWLVGLLTFKTLTAAMTFFGLAGMASLQQGFEMPFPVLIAVASGAAAMLIVAWLMKSLYRLRADGSLRLERAIGREGTVYLPVPGQKKGAGKVHLNLQNRTVEFQAVTAEQDLPVGAPVVVVALVNQDTVEVAPAMVTKG